MSRVRVSGGRAFREVAAQVQQARREKKRRTREAKARKTPKK
jgi:hypothetical protein